jgi:23S rRNA (uracil1939-C5)-methyltransferase
MFNSESRLEVEIIALTTAGGLARHQGKVLFVPGALPGDRCQVEIVAERESYSNARLLGVITPSPDRIEPPCSYFKDCGGCPWQNCAYPAQLRAKTGLVQDAMARIAGLATEVPECLPSPAQFGYRRRIRLLFSGGRLGFRPRMSRDICAVKSCPVASPALNQLLPVLEKALRQQGRRLGVEEVAIRESAMTGELQILLAGKAPHWGSCALALKEAQGQVPKLVSGGTARRFSRQHIGKVNQMMAGEVIWERFGETEAAISPGSFSQANPEAFHSLYHQIGEWAREGSVTDEGWGTRAIDLYSGVGITSLLLARHFPSVVAVEENAEANGSAQHSASRVGLGKRINFITGRAGAVLPTLVTPGVDIILLNPPRVGVEKGLVANITRLAPKTVIYLSCNPATLARDIKEMIAGGYRLKGMVVQDAYPQTAHVETLVRLERG